MMTGIGSPAPFIKDEPDEYSFDPSRFDSSTNGVDMSRQHIQHLGSWQGANGNIIDPSELSMLQPTFGSQQNLSSSFIAGISGIGDDELVAIQDLPDGNRQQGQLQPHQNNFSNQGNYVQSHGFNPGYFTQPHGSMSVPNNHHHNVYATNAYSSTPDGAPMQSPFVNSFNYGQWQSLQPQRQSFGQYPKSPLSMDSASFDVNVWTRSGFPGEDRSSSSKSPITPKTPGTGHLHLGSSESTSLPGQQIHFNHANRGHQKSVSSQWDNTPGSGHSYLDSPLASPHSGPVHNQISEVLRPGKSASPAKVEYSTHVKPGPSVDAKRQRRRESHNAVERRRRNNINDRIHELSILVPQHRLEDDKIRKHLTNNASLPIGITSNGISPPATSSNLSGSAGRKAAGNIAQGPPVDDKEAGPPKGDVLNGAVSWTRDLMWLLKLKLEHEAILLETIENLGGHSPLHISDDEQRMRSELFPAIKRNESDNERLKYSRQHGSGFWVPNFTDPAGQLLNSASPFGSDTNPVGQEQQLWDFNNNRSDTCEPFEEEQDYAMLIE